MEKLFHAFLDGFGEALRGQNGDKAKECCAVLYDAFFLLFGVTPENKAMEMLSITRNFKQQNLSGSAQAWREIVWLLDNYYKHRPDLGETTRHLEDLVKLQLEKYEIRRFFSEAHPITDCLGQFLGGSGIQRSPPSYLQADGPFGLLLHEQSSETREPEEKPMQRQGSDQVVFTKIIYWDLEIARMSRIDHRSEVFFFPCLFYSVGDLASPPHMVLHSRMSGRQLPEGLPTMLGTPQKLSRRASEKRRSASFFKLLRCRKRLASNR